MQVLIRDQFGKTKIMTMQNAPRTGDKVEWTYQPTPTVTNVIWLTDTANLPDFDVIVNID